MPGGTTGARRHTNLSPYLPHDSRNVAVGRADNNYDTVIMYDKESLFRDGIALYMSLKGIVATTRTIGFNYIRLVYVVPNGNYSERWVLYDPELWSSIPTGFTMAPNASNAGRPCYV